MMQNTNPNLPDNAVATHKVKAGDKFTRPFDRTATVYTASRDAWTNGRTVLVYCEGDLTIRCTYGGTFRLV